MKLYGLYQKYNSRRRPEWRWDRVLQMIDRHPTPGRASRRDDDYVRNARNFVLRYRAREKDDREDLFHEHPGLFLAYELFEEQQESEDKSMFLQSRLLSGMNAAAIADAMQTLPQAIEWYEALFFNVRDRLKARDWVAKQVLLPAMMRNFGVYDPDDDPQAQTSSPWSQSVIAKPFLDGSLKMFSYYGGPVLCEFMIAGFQQGKICRSADDINSYLDAHWAMTVRARSAQAARTFEINKFNVMELFMIHAKIMEIEKSSESLDQKRTVIERHVGALIGELEHVWAVGDESGDFGAEVARLDNKPGELRDNELMAVSSGKRVPGTDVLEQLTLPFPTKVGERRATS